MFFWLRRERQQWINAETGFGWFNDRSISPPVKVEETCSVTARKRTSKHWWQAAAERNSSRDAMDIILSPWFCTPLFWELTGEGNIKRAAGSILNQAQRTQHINLLMKILSVTYLWAAKQRENTETRERKNQCNAESDGSGPKKSRCKLLSEQLWASELFTCVLEPKLIPEYMFLPIHLQIQNTQTTTTNLVLQTSPFLSAFLMVYRESNRDSRCCSLNRRHFSVNTSASLISMDGSFPQQK